MKLNNWLRLYPNDTSFQVVGGRSPYGIVFHSAQDVANYFGNIIECEVRTINKNKVAFFGLSNTLNLRTIEAL